MGCLWAPNFSPVTNNSLFLSFSLGYFLSYVTRGQTQRTYIPNHQGWSSFMPAIPNTVFRVHLNMVPVFSADTRGTQKSALSTICFLSLTLVSLIKTKVTSSKRETILSRVWVFSRYTLSNLENQVIQKIRKEPGERKGRSWNNKVKRFLLR